MRSWGRALQACSPRWISKSSLISSTSGFRTVSTTTCSVSTRKNFRKRTAASPFTTGYSLSSLQQLFPKSERTFFSLSKVSELRDRSTGNECSYSFRINAEAGRVENDIYKLKDDSLIDKFEQDPSVASALDPTKDTEQFEGCSIGWEYLPDKNCFHGKTGEGTCRFQSTIFPGKTIIASSDTFIGPDRLWTRDRGVDLDGNKIYGFKRDEHHKCLPCTLYKGSVSFGAERQVQEVVIHNQGGEVKVGEAKCSVKLAQSIDLYRVRGTCTEAIGTWGRGGGGTRDGCSRSELVYDWWSVHQWDRGSPC